MINAAIGYGDRSYTVNIAGHAGYAPKGQDIVCAGVSALTSAFLESLILITNRDYTDGVFIETGDGLFQFGIRGIKDEQANDIVKSLIFMLGRGLDLIERQYPDYISFHTFDFPVEGNDNDTSEQTMNIYREEDKG